MDTNLFMQKMHEGQYILMANHETRFHWKSGLVRSGKSLANTGIVYNGENVKPKH